MRRLSLLLIVLGLLAALYPQINRMYYLSRQASILEQWKETIPAETPAVPAGVGQMLQAESRAGEAEDPAPIKGTGPVAVLLIPRIELEIPVFFGATRANLRLGAALPADSVLPGEAGNAVITAHRSHSYGMQFNRLDELEAGDEIVLHMPSVCYHYNVRAKEILKPGDISLPDAREEESLLTLVTRHPLYSRNPPYRLVVRAGME